MHEIDILRGAALFGILVVNIFYYGLPTEVAGGIPALDDRPGFLVWGVVTALFEFKFFALFSLLFGMSLVLQRESLLLSEIVDVAIETASSSSSVCFTAWGCSTSTSFCPTPFSGPWLLRHFGCQHASPPPSRSACWWSLSYSAPPVRRAT